MNEKDKPETVINFRRRKVPEESDVIKRCIAELKVSDLPIMEAIQDLQAQHPELDADDWQAIGEALLEEANELERHVPGEVGR